MNADKGMIDMINEYLDWAQQQQNGELVSACLAIPMSNYNDSLDCLY